MHQTGIGNISFKTIPLPFDFDDLLYKLKYTNWYFGAAGCTLKVGAAGCTLTARAAGNTNCTP